MARPYSNDLRRKILGRITALSYLPMASRPTKMLLNPECENNEDVEQILRDLCKKIFVEQLDAWCRDPATWPNDRSFDVFCRWFDYHYHSILIDLCDEPLIDESD
jgi:hypothetical protein